MKLIIDTQEKFVKMQGESSRVAITDKFLINVVWHIMIDPESPSQNVPDERIVEQINILNEDFMNNNQDLTDVPNPFKPLIGNPMIQFRTDRILRHQTPEPLGGWGDSDSVKLSDQGGADVIDPERYLNIWVCKIGGTFSFFLLMFILMNSLIQSKVAFLATLSSLGGSPSTMEL